MMQPQPARSIVYRHACDCDTANQPVTVDQPEHRFDVDGQPFPFLITTDGAAFRRLDPLTPTYVCAVTVQAFDPDTLEPVPITFHTGWPEIGGKPFPWQILDCYLHIDSNFHAQLHVEFTADAVDTDGPIEWEEAP